MSGRELQSKHGVGYRTVSAAIASAWPEKQKQPAPRKTRLDGFKPAIDEMLRVDLDAPRKQRHTAKRILDRLLDEHDAAAEGVSYRWFGPTSPSGAGRSGSRPAGGRLRGSCRRPTSPARRPRSTSATSRSAWPVNW
jgi:hypothetical protein